jgi:hypothetical protein
MIRLPVSIGEAIDKLTILDIKCRRIKDPEKKSYCKEEYDILHKEIECYVEKCNVYYEQLYRINDEIWVMQDEIRSMNVPDGEKCIEILNKNDMRFRIKDTINRLSKSIIREQKGYPSRRALFIGHLGLGDHIGLNGAVRYLALQYDELVLVVRHCNLNAVRAMYTDVPWIKFVTIQGGYINSPTPTSAGECLQYNPDEFTRVYKSGFYTYPRNEMDELPHCFYRDMRLDPAIRHIYFNVPLTDAVNELFKPLEGIPYIFVQQKSSDTFTPLITWDKDSVLTIDPNVNPYDEGHKWYTLAESFVNKPFMDYRLVIENASEIHTVDSSFYCFACYLKLKATVKRCYARNTGILIPKYNFI